MTTRHQEQDRGSYAVETAVLLAVVFAVIGLGIAFGRISIADGTVDTAARAGARAASLDRDPGAAQSDADTAARASLEQAGTSCTNVQVAVDTAGFAIPVGQPASVTVTVTCTAQLSDIGVPGLPGSKRISSHFTSTLDMYRARSSS